MIILPLMFNLVAIELLKSFSEIHMTAKLIYGVLDVSLHSFGLKMYCFTT